MRIVVVSNDPIMLQNFRGHILTALLAAGHEVIVVGPDPHLIRIHGVGKTEWEVAGRGTSIVRTVFEAVSLGKHLLHLKPDLVLPFQMKVFVLTAICHGALRNFKFDFILSGLGNGWNISLKSKLFLRPAFTYALNRCRNIYTLNARDTALVRASIRGIPRVHQLPGEGIDLRRYIHSPPSDSPQRTFTFIGRTIAPKGVVVFADAAYRMLHLFPELKVQFLVAGSCSSSDPEYVDMGQVEKHISDTRFKYLGQVNDVPELIARSHFVVLPTYMNEGLPRAALEAFAVGRPIIATDVPGLADVCSFGTDSIRIKQRDVNSLVAAFIEGAALSAAEIYQMGLCGHGKVSAKYTETHVQQSLIPRLIAR